MALVHYQNAYITRSMATALPRFCKFFGIEPASTMQYEGQVPIRTAGGPGLAHQKIVLVWIGGLQYELIEPIGGAVDLYRRELPEDDKLKFHHIAVRSNNWDETCAQLAREGRTIAQEGESGDQLKFNYTDDRATLGHYTEHVWATPERWAMMGWPAGK